MPRFRRTTLIAVGCFSALAGLGLARKISFAPPDIILIFWPILLLLKKKNSFALVMTILLGLGMGLWRGTEYMQKLYELKSLTGYSATVDVTATSDAAYGNRYQMEFTANHAVLTETGQKLAGSFKISGFGENMIYRGDRLEVKGKLYPMRGSNQARIAYAQVKRVGSGQNWYASLSRRFAAGMQNALPEPVASFSMGLLIGQRTNMPDTITAELTAVGLVHIVAVSGYNLTILIRGVQRIRLRSKYQQLVLSLALIGLFVSVTGFSASIVRAALVSVLGLWAWYYGRTLRPIVLIALAAAITGLLNPFYVWGDMSWYLSFLAFFGILIIAPVIQARFFRRQPKFLTAVVLETLSAELMTLPLIMMTFSQLSLVALVANAIIVPLVPMAMLLGAVAGAAGAIIPQLAGWLAWPASLLMTYMLDVIHIMASIPSVLLHASINITYMLSFYLFVLIAVLAARKHSLTKNALILNK